MNRRLVVSFSGLLIMVVAAFMGAPFALALADGARSSAVAYGTGAALTASAGAAMHLWGRHGAAAGELHRKDAFGIVALVWLCLGPFGALPLWLEGSIASPAGAIFEAVSGFTTTGATVVADVDGLSRATNLWRALMHWIGGMGIVVLFVAVFPQIGVGAKQLFFAEAPGPTAEGLRPRIKQTAIVLWWLYAALTAACGLILWGLDLSWYDATVHALSTLGTGGFSSRTASVGHFDSAAVDWTIAAFMLVAGVNFGLYYNAARGRWRDLFRDAELRFYLLVNLLLVAAVALSLLSRHDAMQDTLRHSVFQVLAVTTTTGFMTEDFDTYPNLARFLLFGAMFMGGCAGSTAGGIKVIRVLVLLRVVLREVKTTVQPQAVIPLRLGRRVVSQVVASSVAVFVVAYLALFAVCSAAMVALGLDLMSAMSAVIACLSSIGPGLGAVGPAQNYALVPETGKLLLSFCMIAGRLELFALFAVLSPECWRR